MDISADLTELGRTRVAVVCSGIKSILDIGRSLEYLVKYHRLAKCLFCPQPFPKLSSNIYNNLKTDYKIQSTIVTLSSFFVKSMSHLTQKNKI